MTTRLDAWSVSDSRLSDAENARMEAEAALHATNRRKAVRAIAGAANDVAEARMMFDMLGIQPAEIDAARADLKLRAKGRVTSAA